MEKILSEYKIPIIDYKRNKLNRFERKVSKFFRCISSEECFWSGNNVNKFRKHLIKHNKVFCNYCKFDKLIESQNIDSFLFQNSDQLIEHLIQTHGFRCFQCNQCQYRAKTWTHVVLHQITFHYEIW
jgi:hypothetical protein